MMLIDSNLIIYATQPQHHRLRDWLEEHASHYSAISRLETLGYQHLSATEKQAIINVLDALKLLMISPVTLELVIVFLR